LLGTIQCYVKDNWGEYVRVRCLLDPGSEISIITTALSQRLSLPKIPTNYNVQGIRQGFSKSLGSVQIELKSIKSTMHQQLEAVILPHICNQLPKTHLPSEIYRRFQDLDLADDKFHKPGNIQVLLGADVYTEILSTEEPLIIKGKPAALRTKFGYVIIGRVDQSDHHQVKYQQSRLFTYKQYH